MADRKTHYQPNSPAPSPTCNTIPAEDEVLSSIHRLPVNEQKLYATSGSSPAPCPDYDSLPTEDELLSSIQRLSFEEQNLYDDMHSANSILRSPSHLKWEPTSSKTLQTCAKYLLGGSIRNSSDNCDKLATTEQGCFSLKAVIESIDDPLKSQLLSIIIGEAVYLSKHNYGNSVVQHVLERHPNTANLICNELRGHLLQLSKDKYGSNVVEKCIESNATHVVVSQLLSDCKQLVEVAQDKFGNYVIQKALKLSKGEALRRNRSMNLSYQHHNRSF
ncbi:pumilio homolog 15-like [Papaver somniferum]|uniref:pumilio homolog 15-like n=1 Tax=Papaver somniferum TaxID=3469 RepID=UPI000E7023D7|nr:pumilio homolog 15-like [Papaver somniferum]